MSAYAFWTAIWQGLLASILAYGVFVSFRIIRFPDMTCDGTYPLGAAVAASMIVSGANPYAATVTAVMAGCVAGILTGILHTKFRIPAIVASILVMTGLYSANLLIMMGKPVLHLEKEDTIFAPLYRIQAEVPLPFLGSSAKYLMMPAFFFVIALCVKLCLDRLLGAHLGGALKTTGANPHYARTIGINTDATLLTGLAMANGLIALSGALFAQAQRFSDINLGFGMIVVGLASVFIAEGFETQFVKKKMSTLLVIVGAISYKLAIAAAYEVGLQTDYLNILTAGIVFLALLVPSIRREMSILIKR